MRKRRNPEKRRHGLQMVTLCISTTMVLTMLGLVVLSVLTAHNLQRSMRENVEVSVILSDTVTAASSQLLCRQLQAEPYAREVVYISQHDALEMAKAEMGIDPTDFTGTNPFMPELTVKMEAPYANTDSLTAIRSVLLKDKRVVDVAYTADEIEGMNHILDPINIALLVLSALLIFICYTLISNSIQLSVYSRRFLIHTMKLVGASWGFIRRPFLKQALALGLVSATLTCVLLGAIAYALLPYMPHIEDIMTWRELAVTACCVFVFGFAITMICTLLSVNKFLRMTAGQLYKF